MILDKIIPVYVHYQTTDGLPGVRARTWHPSWFIPVLILRLNYLRKHFSIYKEYQRALQEISREVYGRETKDDKIIGILRGINCGYQCEYVEPYGFVAEAGCPIHD